MKPLLENKAALIQLNIGEMWRDFHRELGSTYPLLCQVVLHAGHRWMLILISLGKVLWLLMGKVIYGLGAIFIWIICPSY